MWRLKRTLYGLKQAARDWHHRLAASIRKLGYIAADASDCLWVKHDDASNDTCIACHHVDDLAVTSSCRRMADELKNALLVNPHDIDGLKEAIVAAVRMPQRERTTRMRALRRRVRDNDVARWSAPFLDTLRHANHHSDAR